MTRDGFFTGLDIGTSSIKVLVAEHRDGEVNVIGVSNAKSKGVKDGIIVDIEANLLQQSNPQSHRQKRKLVFLLSLLTLAFQQTSCKLNQHKE